MEIVVVPDLLFNKIFLFRQKKKKGKDKDKHSSKEKKKQIKLHVDLQEIKSILNYLSGTLGDQVNPLNRRFKQKQKQKQKKKTKKKYGVKSKFY